MKKALLLREFCCDDTWYDGDFAKAIEERVRAIAKLVDAEVVNLNAVNDGSFPRDASLIFILPGESYTGIDKDFCITALSEAGYVVSFTG